MTQAFQVLPVHLHIVGVGGGGSHPDPEMRGARSLHMCWLCAKYLLLDLRLQRRELKRSFF